MCAPVETVFSLKKKVPLVYQNCKTVKFLTFRMTHEVITKAFTEVGAEGHVLILFYKREHLFVTTGIAPWY